MVRSTYRHIDFNITVLIGLVPLKSWDTPGGLHRNVWLSVRPSNISMDIHQILSEILHAHDVRGILVGLRTIDNPKHCLDVSCIILAERNGPWIVQIIDK